MVSVLIPGYNYNAFYLVKELSEQLLGAKIIFEIICIDDCSKSILNKENQQINSLTNASFIELDKNIGRSAMRNLLFKKANYNWLLFLDADVFPVHKNFMATYLSLCVNPNQVFCGGLQYMRSVENKNLLRYKYGIHYEEVGLIKRKKHPFKYFFTSNFLISKEVFKKVQFDEKLMKYGKEDFLFSLNLKANGFEIIHIHNEIYHLGIDTDDIFVSKTKEAMENIVFLNKEKLLSKNEGSLLVLVNFLKRIGLSKVIGKLSVYFEKKAIKKASLFYLNCLKVSYLCYLKEKS